MSSTPRVSILTPVYDDPEGITDTLNSLSEQTYPNDDHEIWVIDEGPESETRRAIERVRERTDAPIKVLTEPPTSTGPAARNKAIEHANGDLFVCIDADMTVDPTWLADCVAAVDRTGAMFAGYNITLTDRDKALRTLAGRYDLVFTFDQRHHIEDEHFSATGGLIVHREVFDEVGLFDPEFISSGDREFGQRVHAAGFDQYYFDDVVGYHPPRTTLRELMSRSVRIGRGKMQAKRNHGFKFDRDLTDPVLYLPNAWPWNAREWAVGSFPDRNAAAWPITTALGLLMTRYLVELCYIVGRLYGWYVDHPATDRR